MTELIAGIKNTSPPSFNQKVRVTQIKKSWLDWAVLVVALLYGAPGFTILIWGFARTDIEADMPLFSLDSIIFLTSPVGAISNA